jgi:hypothetical protein
MLRPFFFEIKKQLQIGGNILKQDVAAFFHPYSLCYSPVPAHQIPADHEKSDQKQKDDYRGHDHREHIVKLIHDSSLWPLHFRQRLTDLGARIRRPPPRLISGRNFHP